MVNYKELYERAGIRIGWNFDSISKRIKTVGKKWNFIDIVKTYAQKKYILLDIGTGGGEKLLQIAKSVKKAYGIDNSKNMILTAKRNMKKSRISNTEFKIADARAIPFPDKYFDVVVCRHAPFYAKELFRVMKSGGIFITQQVGENDKENIKKTFRRGQSFGEKNGTLMNKYIRILRNHGFEILRTSISNSTEYYANISDLIFLLENTPIISGLDIRKDQKYLDILEKKYKTKYGIKTNSSRFLIICRKTTLLRNLRA